MCYGYDEESDTYDNEPWYIEFQDVIRYQTYYKTFER